MSYNYLKLDKETAPYFDVLTFPDYRPALQDFDETVHVAYGAATTDGEPIALVLAVMFPDEPIARILSIFTDPDHRNQGIATRLLTDICDELKARGIAATDGRYVEGKPTTPALERVLAKCNWSKPQLNMVTLRGKAAKGLLVEGYMTESPQLPEGYSFARWVDIAEEQAVEDIEELAKQHKDGKFLHPFKEMGLPLHEETSIVLLKDGHIVGWMINHIVSEDTIRYSRRYVGDNYRGLGLGFALTIESGRRHLQCPDKPYVLMAAEPDNESTIRLIEMLRHLPTGEYNRQMRSHRVLDPDRLVKPDSATPDEAVQPTEAGDIQP